MTVEPSNPDQGKCGTVRRGKPPCGLPAGWGTDHVGSGHCRLHLGTVATHRRSAQVQLARDDCARLGLKIDTTPADALVNEVLEAAGNVSFYRALIQDLPTHPGADVYVVEDETRGHWDRGEPGIYGRTYHVSGLPTGEGKPHVLLQLYNDERKRLVEASTAALRAGVDERRLRLIEDDVSTIMAAQTRALDESGLGHLADAFRRKFIAALAESAPTNMAEASGE